MKKALIYGAGNIGRGFIGQLFHESGYATCFVDVNPLIVGEINLRGEYPVKIVSSDSRYEVTVRNIRAVNGKDTDITASEVANCEILATAVGVNALPHIAESLSLGILLRRENEMPPLNILLCENMMDCSGFLRGLVLQRLGKSLESYLNSHVGFVEASIGRMVPVMTQDMQEGNPLRIWVEPYSSLPVDKDGFRGTIPGILHMEPFSPFSFYIKRKLYIHNMGHAFCAYMGHWEGHQYIHEAVGDRVIHAAVANAMEDCASALIQEYGIPKAPLQEHIADLLRRFGNKALGDTVERVAREPERKLKPSDRLTGAALYCLSMSIPTGNISRGIAYGLRYLSSEKPAEELVKEYCMLEDGHPVFVEVVREYNEMGNWPKH
ncbi:MAG: mannitol dehydrogenase [Clostridia bacterium]